MDNDKLIALALSVGAEHYGIGCFDGKPNEWWYRMSLTTLRAFAEAVQPKWISVSERLPEKHKYVPVIDRDGSLEMSLWRQSIGGLGTNGPPEWITNYTGEESLPRYWLDGVPTTPKE